MFFINILSVICIQVDMLTPVGTRLWRISEGENAHNCNEQIKCLKLEIAFSNGCWNYQN